MKNSMSSNVVPSFDQFTQFARRYNRIPVFLTLQSDLETPLSAYLKLGQGENAFLLESVEKNEQIARYSIVGFDPSEIFEAPKWSSPAPPGGPHQKPQDRKPPSRDQEKNGSGPASPRSRFGIFRGIGGHYRL